MPAKWLARTSHAWSQHRGKRSFRSRGLRALVLAAALLALVPAPAHAYVGPGPGLEFVPYFFALIAWAGVAIGAIVFWPFSALIRRLRGGRPQPSGPSEEQANPDDSRRDVP